MIADEIRELQHASPFKPYTIQTSDGKALYVHHPDYLFITPGNHTVYVSGTAALGAACVGEAVLRTCIVALRFNACTSSQLTWCNAVSAPR